MNATDAANLDQLLAAIDRRRRRLSIPERLMDWTLDHLYRQADRIVSRIIRS